MSGFSLAYLTLYGCPPAEQIEIAAACGYDSVSLRTVPQGLFGEPSYRLEKDPILYNEIHAALRHTGLSLADVGLIRVQEGLDILCYEETFEKAAELGAEDVVCSVWTQSLDFATPEFATVCDMARQYGLRVNLEFVPYSGVKSLKAAMSLLDQVNRPNARILVDLLHAHRCGVTPAELAQAPPERFGIVHVCDGPAEIPTPDDPAMLSVTRAGRLQPGEGGIDVAGLLRALPQCLYAIEQPNLEKLASQGRLAYAKACLNATKAYLAANGIFPTHQAHPVPSSTSIPS